MQEASAIDRAASPVMALLSSPIGAPVRAVARIRASVHVKLLAGFLLITVLFIAITAVGLRTLTETTRQTNLLDQAHVRVGWSHRSSTHSPCRCTSRPWPCWPSPRTR